MKKAFLLTACFISCLHLFAQNENCETFKNTEITVFDDVPNNTVYSAIQQIYNANYPLSYLAPSPTFKSLEPRKVPLQFGEGQKGFLVEGLTDLQFTLVQGRRIYANHFWQTTRISFRYAPTLRMTFDNSSNLLPSNHKVGLQWEKAIWDSYTKNVIIGSKNDSYDIRQQNWADEHKPLHLLYFNASAIHYSNGQGAGVWLNESKNRNDYNKGDFSTNMVSLMINYSYFNNYLISGGVGYQNDGEWGGPFSFTAEQNSRYGRNRINGYLQALSSPQRHPLNHKITYEDHPNNRYFTIDPKWEWKARFEWEYILGNLTNYIRDRKYRFNSHLYIEGMPLRSRTLGYMAHLYYGRDYLNIRYDDPVFAAMIGVTFHINKFRNPWFKPCSAIIGSTPGKSPTLQRMETKRSDVDKVTNKSKEQQNQ